MLADEGMQKLSAWSAGEVVIDMEDKMLVVHDLVAIGVASRFPFVFLRDNCVCNECFHSKS